jgi:hypothetical protein
MVDSEMCRYQCPLGESSRQARRGQSIHPVFQFSRQKKKTSPVATAPDPPVGGRVLQSFSIKQFKSCTTSPLGGNVGNPNADGDCRGRVGDNRVSPLCGQVPGPDRGFRSHSLAIQPIQSIEAESAE